MERTVRYSCRGMKIGIWLLGLAICFTTSILTPNYAAKAQSETPAEVIPQIGSAAFSGTDLIWLVTRRPGYLLHSSDAGKIWQRQRAGQITKSSEVSFIDADHGWSISSSANHDGQIWWTTDGGSTWSLLATLKSDRPGWRFTAAVQLVFVDRQIGWLIETFSVWRTSDGGTTWRQVLSTAQMGGAQPSVGRFLDPLTAWISGGGKVFRTADGGITWDAQSVVDNIHFSDIFFIDQQTGWGVSGNRVYFTGDSGRNWRLQSILAQAWQIESCHFVSEKEGWAAGMRLLGPSFGLPQTNIMHNLARGIVLHTLDGGETWQMVNLGKHEPFFRRVHFSNAQQGWVFSRDKIYRTANSGRTWRLVLTLPPLKS